MEKIVNVTWLDENKQRDYLWYCPICKVFHPGHLNETPVCPIENKFYEEAL